MNWMPAEVDFSSVQPIAIFEGSSAQQSNSIECTDLDQEKPIVSLTRIPIAEMPIDQGRDWSNSDANHSVRGEYPINPNYTANCPRFPRQVPFGFVAPYSEMESFRILENGWDYLGSEGISDTAIDNALEFLVKLPSAIMPPEASASGGGTVDWYWTIGQSAATLTFFASGRVAYFAMTDAGSTKGTFEFRGTIPSELFECLRQL